MHRSAFVISQLCPAGATQASRQTSFRKVLPAGQLPVRSTIKTNRLIIVAHHMLNPFIPSPVYDVLVFLFHSLCYDNSLISQFIDHRHFHPPSPTLHLQHIYTVFVSYVNNPRLGLSLIHI